jgi:hypothetical protein
MCACVNAFRLPHALRIIKQFNEFLGILNKLLSLGFGILLLLHWILLAFQMLILRVVEFIEKALLVHATFLDLLSFVGLLVNNLLLLNPPQRLSM